MDSKRGERRFSKLILIAILLMSLIISDLPKDISRSFGEINLRKIIERFWGEENLF